MASEAAAIAVPAERPQVNRWLVTLAVTVGTLMGAIDASIVNVALPDIRANLGATLPEVAWISTGYIIALVIIMPLTAWLGLTFGRKRVYMFCLALFTASSFFCGMAGSLSILIIFRVIQGLGAGALQPTEQAILRETFPVEEQGLAMSLYGVAVMIGPAIGPTLGGWITDNYNWPWIFYVNIPVGIVGMWMVSQFVHDPPHVQANRSQAGVDAVGIGLLAIGLASLQVVLEEGETYDWFSSNLIAGLAVIALVALVTFVWWEMRVEKPAVDFSVLRDASFSTGTLIGGILGVSLFGSMFLLPLFLQTLLGYTAMQSGLVLMPRSLVMICLMPIAGLLYNRLGPKVMVGSGLAVAGMAPILMSHFTLSTGGIDLFWPQVVQGLGFVMMFVALSTSALAGIEKRKLTSATGLYNLIRQLGGSFGVAIFATMVTREQQTNHALLAGHINPYNPAFVERFQMIERGLIARGIDPWAAQQKALAMFDGIISQQAAVLAFERAFFIIGLLFFLCIPLVFLLKTPAALRRRHAEPLEA